MKDSAHLTSYPQGNLLILVVILLLAFGFPAPVYAQGILYGDTLPAGTVVEGDVLLIGQNVVLDGTVNGNVFILGNQVMVNGTVDGSLILIGQNAAIGGTVSGAVYASALTLELSSGAALKRDLYITTVSLVTRPESAIQRDLFALSLDAGLNGQIGRNMHTAIGPIQLYNGLMRLLGFEELTLELRFDRTLPPAQPTPVPPAKATPTSLQPSHPRVLARRVLQQPQPFDWRVWTINIAREWMVLALFGLLVFALARRALGSAGQPLNARPWQTTALGFLVLVIVVNLFGVALLFAVLIFSIGLGLNYVGLWQLSIALWIAAYSGLALTLVALWFFVVYGTKLIVAYLISSWLISRAGSPSSSLSALGLVAALLVFVLLRAVPYVGWVFGVLVTAAGLGSAWLAYRSAREAAPQIAAKPQARKASARG